MSKEVKIKEGYTYLEFDSDCQCFAKAAELLQQGYQITDTIFLCVEFSKGNESFLLSYLPINPIDENIKKNILALYPPHKTVLPDYQDTFLNVVSAIRENYGYSHRYSPMPDLFDKPYEKVIILLLDGMGMNVLQKNLGEDSFLRRHLFKELHSVYPSTTAAATTSIKSGLPPITTGWTGWENYVREIDRNVVLFRGTDYYTGNATGISLYDYIPYTMFYEDMNLSGYCIEPDFSKPILKIKDVLKRSLKLNRQKKRQVQYVYFTEPDSTMHEFGTYSEEAKRVCRLLDEEVEAYASSLTEGTLLIITADHGHTPVFPISLYACKPILRLLSRKPSNDARCITFSVQKGKEVEFETVFRGLFSGVYRLYKTEEAIRLGFFGLPEDMVNPRCADFLADYTAVATGNRYFNYIDKDHIVFKSHHAGITRDEMLVPVCVVRK